MVASWRSLSWTASVPLGPTASLTVPVVLDDHLRGELVSAVAGVVLAVHMLWASTFTVLGPTVLGIYGCAVWILQHWAQGAAWA